jgi:hypothetical protein
MSGKVADVQSPEVNVVPGILPVVAAKWNFDFVRYRQLDGPVSGAGELLRHVFDTLGRTFSTAIVIAFTVVVRTIR